MTLILDADGVVTYALVGDAWWHSWFDDWEARTRKRWMVAPVHEEARGGIVGAGSTAGSTAPVTWR